MNKDLQNEDNEKIIINFEKPNVEIDKKTKKEIYKMLEKEIDQNEIKVENKERKSRFKLNIISSIAAVIVLVIGISIFTLNKNDVPIINKIPGINKIGPEKVSAAEAIKLNQQTVANQVKQYKFCQAQKVYYSELVEDDYSAKLSQTEISDVVEDNVNKIEYSRSSATNADNLHYEIKALPSAKPEFDINYLFSSGNGYNPTALIHLEAYNKRDAKELKDLDIIFKYLGKTPLSAQIELAGDAEFVDLGLTFKQINDAAKKLNISLGLDKMISFSPLYTKPLKLYTQGGNLTSDVKDEYLDFVEQSNSTDFHSRYFISNLQNLMFAGNMSKLIEILSKEDHFGKAKIDDHKYQYTGMSDLATVSFIFDSKLKRIVDIKVDKKFSLTELSLKDIKCSDQKSELVQSVLKEINDSAKMPTEENNAQISVGKAYIEESYYSDKNN